jgi:hypothetical protein
MLGGVVLCAALVCALFSSVAGSAISGSSTWTGVPVGTFAGCPRRVRPLPEQLARYEATASRVALRFVRTGFLKYAQTPAMNLVGARVRRVLPVRNWGPSGWVKTECGLSVWERSVTVLVYFPRLDKPHNPIGHCNACAQLTFLLALTPGGWAVWGRY